VLDPWVALSARDRRRRAAAVGQIVLNCSNGWRQLSHQRIERHGVGPKMFSRRVSVEPQ
jgi:hypothetical protein